MENFALVAMKSAKEDLINQKQIREFLMLLRDAHALMMVPYFSYFFILFFFLFIFFGSFIPFFFPFFHFQ